MMPTRTMTTARHCRFDARCSKGDVVTNYSMWTTDDKGKRMTKVAQLRAAVLEHLVWKHQYIGA